MMRSNFDNMLICDIASGGGYNYYSYVESGTSARMAIIRENTAETEYRYFFGKASDYAANWAARATLAVNFPSAISGRG